MCNRADWTQFLCARAPAIGLKYPRAATLFAAEKRPLTTLSRAPSTRTPKPMPHQRKKDEEPPSAYILQILDTECPATTSAPPAKRIVALEIQKRRELQTYLALAAKRLVTSP